jgi:hypothetical protein
MLSRLGGEAGSSGVLRGAAPKERLTANIGRPTLEKYGTNPTMLCFGTPLTRFRDYRRVPGGEWRYEPKVCKRKEIEIM